MQPLGRRLSADTAEKHHQKLPVPWGQTSAGSWTRFTGGYRAQRAMGAVGSRGSDNRLRRTLEVFAYLTIAQKVADFFERPL